MASKQTYECYVCKHSGFNDVRVYLDGKTEDGKTIYKNEDMSPHQHKKKQQQPQQHQQESQSKSSPSDRMIIAMLEGLTNRWTTLSNC